MVLLAAQAIGTEPVALTNTGLVKYAPTCTRRVWALFQRSLCPNHHRDKLRLLVIIAKFVPQ